MRWLPAEHDHRSTALGLAVSNPLIAGINSVCVDYVPDTSVIVDGRFYSFITSKKGESRIILAEAMLAEVEHQANEGRSIGFAALEELKKIRDLSNDGSVFIDIQGRRPSDWQIRRAKSGEIDEIIRTVAAENDAILVTGDNIQRDLAQIKGIKVEYLQHPESIVRNIEEFFDEITTSVHLKPDMHPLVKKGYPGSVEYEKLNYKVSTKDLESVASNIVKRGKLEDQSFIEMDMHGATVIQLRNIRIVITRPPFSDDLEITAVRPIKKLSMEEYKLPENLISRLENQANGILVAGSPGAGKSTFVQALAEFYSAKNKLVKTMEKPRDLQVAKEITQYTGLEGSMEKTGDILLLVRSDYSIFDEMRVTSDFKVYADLRLAGVGMVGVVHATRPIDAIQRFIGRIELGLIPQVIDTVLYIENGKVAKVLTLRYVVKVPSGMTQEDLARPVIVVDDFFSGTTTYEIYSFGEQIVVVPVSSGKAGTAVQKLATEMIYNELRRRLGTDRIHVKLIDDGRALVQVDEEHIPKLIGKKGVNISNLEKKLSMGIEVEPIIERGYADREIAHIEIKNKNIYIDVGVSNKQVRFYVDDILVLSAKSSAKGVVRLRIASDTGSALYKAIKSGKKIEYSFTESAE